MTETRHTRKRCIAKGVRRSTTRDPAGLHRECCIRFEAEQFDEVRAYAEENDFSFGEAIRTLCEIGLLTLREGENEK